MIKVSVSRFVVLVSALFALPLAHAQLRPELANCPDLGDLVTQGQIAACTGHIGCNMILKLKADCPKAKDFMRKLQDALAGRREITNNDVFEANTPALTSEENLKRHIAVVQQIVRDARDDPNKEIKDTKSPGGDRVYYEGGINKARNMHGVGVFINENGSMARGQANNGLLEGQAQIIFSNGAVLAGSFRDTKLHGQGANQAFNGFVWSGDWNEGKPKGLFEGTARSGLHWKQLFDAEGNELAKGPVASPGQIAQAPGASASNPSAGYSAQADDPKVLGGSFRR